ncbi:MAG: hypothetical protein R3E65_06655 [Steroidobacteraceae bacterium]
MRSANERPAECRQIFACRCGTAKCRGTMLWPPKRPEPKPRKKAAKRSASAGKRAGKR